MEIGQKLSNAEILERISNLENSISSMTKDLCFLKQNVINKKSFVNETTLNLFIYKLINKIGYDFTLRSNERNVVIVRQIVSYLLYTNFSDILSYKQIGKLFEKEHGVRGQDHSTILHAVKVARDLRSNGDSLYETYNDIIEPIFNNHFLNLNK
jgi:chromosomal replication initiation ATPase DnaA